MSAQSEKPQNPRPPQPGQSENNQTKSDNKTSPIVTGPPQISSNPETEPTNNPRNDNNWTKFHPERWTNWLLVLFNGSLALFTYFLWDSSDKLWKSGEQQIAIARDAANAAKKAAEVAEKSLALADRPWLKIELGISGPLKFIKFGEKTAIRTSIQIKIKNIGRSVARDIRHDCQIYIPPLFRKGYQFDEVSFQKELFNKLTTERMHPLDEGHCIFPDDETIFTKNLDYFIKENDFTYIEGFEEMEGRKLPPGYLNPILVICCVDYQFDTSTDHHQTGVIDRIIQTTPFTEGKSGPTINNARAIKVNDEIPVNELIITRYALAGRQAN